MAEAAGIEAGAGVRRVMGARARETVNDIMRTAEQIMGFTPEESGEWLKGQIDQVANLRTGKKEGQ